MKKVQERFIHSIILISILNKFVMLLYSKFQLNHVHLIYQIKFQFNNIAIINIF